MSETEKGLSIMKKLEELQHQYKDNYDHELLVGGYDNYIYSEKYYEMAKEHNYLKGDSFHIEDENVIQKVIDYISNDRMIIIVARTQENRIDLYLEPI